MAVANAGSPLPSTPGAVTRRPPAGQKASSFSMTKNVTNPASISPESSRPRQDPHSVKAYLDIERLRLGPRFRTIIEVAKDAEQTLIPILFVHPLVENAIKHGLALCSDEGRLRLTAKLVDGSLTIVVEHSGSGGVSNTPTARPAGAGVGLANVIRRLQLCFGHVAAVTLDQGDYGTRVQFSVPRRETTVKSQTTPGFPE
jgi:LytS/YehU family sensor histidine kinase